MLHFPTEKVDAHITRIYAFGTELMYLVEGSTGNVLLDTGSGFGSLKAATDAILASHENTNPLKALNARSRRPCERIWRVCEYRDSGLYEHERYLYL